MRATPSPVSRTMPTLLFVVDVFRSPIFDSISSSMVLMVLNSIVRVEGVRGGCGRFRPRHHFRHGFAFPPAVGDQHEIARINRRRICFSDSPQFPNVPLDLLRWPFPPWLAVSPPLAGASGGTVLARRCSCVTFLQ